MTSLSFSFENPAQQVHVFFQPSVDPRSGRPRAWDAQVSLEGTPGFIDPKAFEHEDLVDKLLDAMDGEGYTNVYFM